MGKRRVGPVVEDLREAQRLNPAVETRGTYSYDEARPSRVEDPNRYNNGMLQLADALKGLEPTLAGYGKDLMERKAKEAMAEGTQLFQTDGTDPLTGNMLAWKDLVTQRPELAGANPHLQRGYEQSRLKNMGLEYTQGLELRYSESGLHNEADPAKMNQMMAEYDKEFREKNLKDFNGDNLDLLEHFESSAIQAKQRLSGKYLGDREKANLYRAEEAGGVLISNILNGIYTDPVPDLSHPDVSAQVHSTAAEKITYEARRMVLQGMNAEQVDTVVANSVLAQAKQQIADKDYSAAERTMGILEQVQTGTGVLAKKPAIKTALSGVELEIRRNRKADEADRRAEEDHQRGAYERSVMDKAGRYLIQNPSATIEDLVKATGAPGRKFDELIRMQKTIQAGKEASPAAERQWLEDYIRARNGDMPADVVLTRGYDINKAKTLIDTQEAFEKNAEAIVVGGLKTHHTNLSKLIAGKDVTSGMTSNDEGDPFVVKAIQAQQYCDDIYLAKVEEWQEKNPDRKLSPIKARKMAYEAFEETISKPQFRPEGMQPLVPQDAATVPQLFNDPASLTSAWKEYVEAGANGKNTPFGQLMLEHGVTDPKAMFATQAKAVGLTINMPSTPGEKAGSKGEGEWRNTMSSH